MLLGCCTIWGLQQVMVKATIPEVPPILQASIRSMGAGSLLWLWCRGRGIALFERDGSLLAGLLAGLLFSFEFACVFSGMQHTAASRLTMFLYTSPFWVAAILPLLVPDEKLRVSQWAGLACAFAALVFSLREGLSASAQPTQLAGDLLGLAAGALWGLTTVVIRSSTLARVSPEKQLFYQLAISALVLPPLSLALGESWSIRPGAFSVASLLYQSLVGAFASYLLWMWLLGHYPATRVAAFVFLTPLVALLFGTLWLGEQLTSGLLSALTLVAFGIMLVNRR